MDFRFSVVMAAYNSGAYIKQALDSLINQSLDFKENIQVIIVNDASTDNTETVCKEYIEKYPDNIVLINNKTNCGPAHTRNVGLHYATGQIINFLDSDDYISKKTFEKVDIFFDDFVHVDIASIPIKFFGSKRGDHPLNYKFKGTGVINLLENPDAIQLSSASAFFRSEIIKDRVFNEVSSKFDQSISTVFNENKSIDGPIPMVFNENLSVSEDALLINQLLLRNPLLGILSRCTYYYRKKETDNTSLISDSANHKSYFTSRVDNYMIRLINDSLDLYGKVPEFIQYAVMYDLQWIMEIRQVDHLLNLDELTRLYDKLISILFYIGDKVILNQRSIPSILKAHIILIKYFKWDYLDEKTFNFKQIEEKYYSHIDNLIPFIGKDQLSFIIQKLVLNKIYLDIVEVKNIRPKNNLNDSIFNSSQDENGLGLSEDEDEFELSRQDENVDSSNIDPDDAGANDDAHQELYVSGMITSFFNKDFDIYAIISEKDNNGLHVMEREIKTKKVSYPQRDNLSLNFNYGYNQNFEVSIPITDMTSRISFRTSFKSLNEVCDELGIETKDKDSFDYLNHHDLNFSGDLLIDYNHTSRLSRISNYKISKDYLILDNGNHIIVRDRSILGMLKYELVTLFSIIVNREEGWRTGILLRLLYFVLYPFYRNKRIWIFMDLPYTADDNGIQLFKSVRKMDNLKLEEYNQLLALDESLISRTRHPYKYELFEGKDVKLIGLIKDLYSSVKNIRHSNELKEDNSKVKFINRGSLGLDDKYDELNDVEDYSDYLNEHFGFNDSQEDDGYLETSDIQVKGSSFEDDLEHSTEFRKKVYGKAGFVKSFDARIDAKYNQMIENLDSKFDKRYNDLKTKTRNADVKGKVGLDRDNDDNFSNSFSLLDAIYNFDFSKFLSENKFVYLINYILYRISKLLLRRRKVKTIDNRKIKKYFTLEQSTSHFNNVRHMENQYIASSNKDKLKKLFAREKESREYREIKKIGPVLAYKSLKHRIYTLFAEVIVSSHPDNNLIYPFYGNFPHLAGLVKAKTVFLQHGVTKDDVSFWLNRFDKNLDMIVTVSDKEKESFLPGFDDEGNYLASYYGYDEEIIKVLGFPRFDYLNRLEDKKEIIVMPTWRRQLHNLKEEQFVKTNFFNTFNELINDEVLLDYLASKGYKLVFKPHPNLNKYINLFNQDSRVEFDLNDLNYSDLNRNDKNKYSSRRYADIFNHSSLIVTDFSSVSFDFAYLKKPLIYYHYDNDYHFDSENGYFDYETMGFGPVVMSHKDLVSGIIKQIDSGCTMDDLYKKRVDDFFKYKDRDNSRRVYKAILEMDRYY